jgi:hypothetical protein
VPAVLVVLSRVERAIPHSRRVVEVDTSLTGQTVTSKGITMTKKKTMPER